MARLIAIISSLLLAAAALSATSAAFAADQLGHAGRTHAGERAHAARNHGHHRRGARPAGMHRHSHHGKHRKHLTRKARKAQREVRAAHRSSASGHRSAKRSARRERARSTSGGNSKRRAQPQAASDGVCSGEALVPTEANLPQVREATFCLVNEQRAIHGLPPLRDVSKLDASAQAHTASMIEAGYFGHYGPGGDTPVDRMKASGYIYSARIGYAVGENIAWGTLALATPKATVEAWMASPGHRENILSARYRDSGIGVLAATPGTRGNGERGATYTQDFGVIIAG